MKINAGKKGLVMKKIKIRLRKKIRHNVNYAILILIFHLFSLILFSCSSPPEANDDTVTFSGTVTLEDTADFSGVTVSLYEPVELDTAIVRINQEYPHIGVQISQETEFDHREHTPKYTTTTKADGSWKIEGVKKGTYNVVAEKEGWGWMYFTNLELIANMTKDLGILPKIIVLNSNLTQDIILKENQHVLITSNIVIPENISLNAKQNNWISLARNVSVEIYGTIDITNSRVVCNTLEEKWQDIETKNNGKILLNYVVVKNSSAGIKWSGQDQVIIKNCIFTENERALQIVNSRMGLLENSVVTENTEGLSFGTVDSMVVRDMIMINNDYALIGSKGILITKNCNISHSAICAVDFSIGNAHIKNNQFEKNILALNFSAKNKYEINYNNFIQNETDIQTNYIYYNGTGLYQIHENNFIDTKKFFIYQNTGSAKDTLHAEYNYWGMDEENDIKLKIIDFYDKNELMVVEIFPIFLNRIQSAGISR